MRHAPQGTVKQALSTLLAAHGFEKNADVVSLVSQCKSLSYEGGSRPHALSLPRVNGSLQSGTVWTAGSQAVPWVERCAQLALPTR
jgi:hypothetical protein